MKLFIFSFFLIFSLFAADEIIVPPGGNKAFFKDVTGNLMPLKIAYSTDGNGVLKLINLDNPVDDTILVPPNSGLMFLQAHDDKIYPATVLYTTDGNGHVIPIPYYTFSPPFTASGSAISMPAATDSVDGYLTHTDHALFSAHVTPHYATTATNYQAASTDRVIGVTAVSATLTVTLALSASVTVSEMVVIKDESGSASVFNYITVQAKGSDTIDGVTSLPITASYGVLKLYSNGAGKWFSL